MVFQKRMTFSKHNNRKLQAKIIEAYIINKRVGSGLYLVEQIETKEVKLLPVCQLIRTRLSIEEVRNVIREISGS